MPKLNYTYEIENDTILVVDTTSGGVAMTNNINKIASEIMDETGLTYEEFMAKHLIYRNHRDKYNGIRFNKDKSVQFFSLNASSEKKALEYLKRVKTIHA